MKVNKELKKYIEQNILPIYKKNDLGHDSKHIEYVIKRSIKFANKFKNINYDMIYTIAAYHDIGHYINPQKHEIESAKIFINDKKIKNYFNEKEIKIITDAIIDHRASSAKIPRTIYGKIISTADRNINIDDILKRTYNYRIKNYPNENIEELIENSRKHIIKKFGPKGYATNKNYLKDNEYNIFLKKIKRLSNNKEIFKEKFIKINNIK